MYYKKIAMINLLKEYKKVERFEQALSEYTGAPYVVCVDSCTSALLLSLKYSGVTEVILPANTYVGVAMAARNIGINVEYRDIEWKGIYKIEPTNVIDSAKRFTGNMYVVNSMMGLSFHYKKHLKIGRGGAILTDSYDACEWFKLARNNGRRIDTPLCEQTFTVQGYNMLLHPDLASKGLRLLKKLSYNNDDLPYEYYGDLRTQLKITS
jgi:dTDP-4-amino-4,6-dideoxygalactose transaminase